MEHDDAYLPEGEGLSAPTRRRRMWLAIACGCLMPILLACCFMGIALKQQILTSVATLDRRVILEVDSDDPKTVEQVRSCLKGRLRSFVLAGKVRRAEGNRIAVDMPKEVYELTGHEVFTQGRLRFLLLAPHEGADYDAEVARITKLKADGAYDPATDRFDVFPSAPDARGLEGAQVLVEQKPEIRGRDFLNVNRALDAQGRPCVGFTMTVKGRKKLYDLTSNNVGRNLAIVMDGVVKSAPVIRGAIGKKGIIEGGDKGWSPEELERLIKLLDDPLPARVSFVEVQDVGGN